MILRRHANHPAGGLHALLRQNRLSPRCIADQVIVLTVVSERWLKDLKPWQAVIAANALVQLAQERLAEIIASWDRGESPEAEWKRALAGLAPDAVARIPTQEP